MNPLHGVHNLHLTLFRVIRDDDHALKPTWYRLSGYSPFVKKG